MDDDGDEKVIDLGRTFHLPSPSEIAANPRPFLTPEQQHGPEKPERKARQRPDVSPKPGGDHPGGGPEFFDDESSSYKAFGWAGNKTLPTLRVILKDGSEWAIVYAHLDTNPENGSQFLPKPPGRKGNLVFLRVVGSDGVFMIVIEGIRLRRVWELIMGHLTPWIHELPEGTGFVGDDEPVIWSITAKAIKPER